jgi:hypothetical protein
MAAKKKPPRSKKSPGSSLRNAVEVVVEVPKGSRRSKVDKLIQSALRRRVPTDVFADEQKVIVTVQTNGNNGGS